MLPKVINLLPQEYIHALHREYILRVVVLAVLCVTAAIFVSSALLVPSFIYERREIATSKNALDQFSHTYATQEEKNINDQLTTLSQQATYLSNLSAVPTFSATLRQLVAVPHAGVILKHFTFTAPTKSTASTLQVIGVASTRETLRAYSAALETLPFVASSDLPISDYAQATNIPFTDTLTLSYKTQ